jgi:hypothetical protein
VDADYLTLVSRTLWIRGAAGSESDEEFATAVSASGRLQTSAFDPKPTLSPIVALLAGDSSSGALT